MGRTRKNGRITTGRRPQWPNWIHFMVIYREGSFKTDYLGWGWRGWGEWMRKTSWNKQNAFISDCLVSHQLTMVWKQECSCTRNGGLLERAKTRFSIMVHSTSSSWIMTSFFRILMAYSSSVPLRSANITCVRHEMIHMRIFTLRLKGLWQQLSLWWKKKLGHPVNKGAINQAQVKTTWPSQDWNTCEPISMLLLHKFA